VPSLVEARANARAQSADHHPCGQKRPYQTEWQKRNATPGAFTGRWKKRSL
jgi:hypothetical protein